ncbi:MULTISPECIES: DUF2975 domain-containing protein [Glutamicibacter]|uniref:DUF2975 domain-containing protein n=1 Tax=Glutamicibacter halophytocola TaxID=1933880 RepID=A0A5B8I477_9MICC|nr:MULTISPECIES: DUF2975 domain-containing protein [Glutamicibacter]ALG28612.1 hypothetical protein AOZ07_06145 [Glutamicibacter halophytocola]MBF6672136.1 DUF2975 domain-containing protein [Glutamicibacter sp. FBE19]QDY67909.1 DUF2975 domain-containing protein [Glutamicibacter halophytocola]UUX60089.1 DUF2975 domain-containing protein [Glutamicibacter halophytocola]
MGKFSIVGLKVILAVILAGTFFVQLFMIPMIFIHESPSDGTEKFFQGSFLSYLFLAGLIIETCVYCVWKLATRVKRGTVFDPASLGYVTPIIIAFAVGALATLALGAIFAASTEIAPGVVLLVGGAGLLMIGISIIVLVLRQLLEQAAMTEAQAAELRTELGGVI